MSEKTRKLLNSLVDAGYTASIGKSSTMSALLRFGEDNKVLFKELTNRGERFSPICYLFEIGRNCGTVFSASIVDSVEIKDHHCIIHLKG